MMLTSYHNHTRWSDGTTTVAAMVQAAEELGLDEVGFSDHLVVLSDGQRVDWSIAPGSEDAYVEDVLRAVRSSVRPTVRLGLEVDYLPQSADKLPAMLSRWPLDYVIGSVHFVDGFPVDGNPRDWQPLSQAQVDRVWRTYWVLVRQMAESRLFDFAAHLDLAKKFGFLPSVDMSQEAADALDAIAQAGMAIEINTAGWSLPAREAYPSPSLLRQARERDIPLVINADAHSPAHLTRHFEQARILAREVGYREVVRYEARQRHPVPV